MADANVKNGKTGANSLSEASKRVLDNLAELEPALISAGVFEQSGEVLALVSETPGWSGEAKTLIASLSEASGAEDFDSAHVACENGEVFVVAEGELTLVAVTGRFVLASLTTYDMRMALRDLMGGESENA